VPSPSDTSAAASSDREAALAEALGRRWYHTIELAPGRVTDGVVDHRRTAPRLLPPDLTGLRCLDVGTFDGYWAFAMEERGAEHVTAIDLDRYDDAEWPPRNAPALAAESGDESPGVRFALAHRARASSVERVVCPIYDLDADALDGTFDRAVLSDLLLHVRDPVGALEGVRRVLRPGGRLLVAEEVNVRLSALWPRRPAAHLQSGWTQYGWWQANVAGLHEWLHQAGFRVLKRTFYVLDATEGLSHPHMAFEVEPDPDAPQATAPASASGPRTPGGRHRGPVAR
jgi:SAM-dependent methyltransferase